MKFKNGLSFIEKTIRKMSSPSGESLSETLISLLVAALALTMLAGAISASANVIIKSRNAMNDYYDASQEIITMSGVKKTGKTVTITPNDNSFRPISVSVEYYENDKTPVIAYDSAS